MLHPTIDVQLHPDRERLFLAVDGEIDVATAPRIRSVVDDAIADGWRDLVLDLRRVRFMDSTGVHLLLDLRRLGLDGVSCSMLDGASCVDRVLAISGLRDVLPRADRLAL